MEKLSVLCIIYDTNSIPIVFESHFHLYVCEFSINLAFILVWELGLGLGLGLDHAHLVLGFLLKIFQFENKKKC